MSTIYLLNKPYGVLCQFKRTDERPTLANFIDTPDVYPAGRLDHDSEGLVLLTNDGDLQTRIAHPKYKLPKTYWVQVEGDITNDALSQLHHGVSLNDGQTRPAKVKKITEPTNLWPRNPPVRFRKNIPTSWIELTITEGRNRQVRRMTASVGFPTLRLVRVRIGNWTLDNLNPGEHRSETVHLAKPVSHHHQSNQKHSHGKSNTPHRRHRR